VNLIFPAEHALLDFWVTLNDLTHAALTLEASIH